MIMHKVNLLLSALCFAKIAYATHNIWIVNNDGFKSRILTVPDGSRYCYCLSDTQTATIEGTEEGNLKLFSRSDCTGNYVDGSGRVINNAQWVNSVSFGEGGIPSTWAENKRCSWYL